MPTEADFLAAIREEPGDLTNKLVFADWLEEHDDPRAELARGIAQYQQVQVPDLLTPGFSTFPLPVPVRLVNGQNPRNSGALTVAPQGLLAWTGSLAHAEARRAENSPWWPWVTHFRLHGDRQQVAEFLRRQPRPPVYVEWLLNPHDIDSVISHDPLLERIQGLTFTGADLVWRDGTTQLLQSPMPGLRRLDVGTRMLTPPALDALAGNASLSQLQSLFLGHAPQDRGAFGRLLRAPWWPLVRELRLLCQHTDGPLLRLLAGSSTSTGLRVLEIDQPGTGLLDLEGLSGAVFWPGLRALSIGTHRLETDALRRLLNMLQQSELLALRLPFRTPSPDVVRVVAECSYLKRTTHLTLGGEMPRCQPLKVLAGSRHLSQIHTLDLRAPEVNDTQVENLADWPHLDRLRVLRLFRNTCTARGATWLAHQPELRGLIGLDLALAPLRVEAITALGNSPHLRGLLHLVLASSDESRPVLQALFPQVWNLIQ